MDAFRAHVVTLPETVAVYHVAGESDFLVHVAVRDAEHLRNLTLDGFTTRTEVARLNTALIYEHAMNFRLPNYQLKIRPMAIHMALAHCLMSPRNVRLMLGF